MTGTIALRRTFGAAAVALLALSACSSGAEDGGVASAGGEADQAENGDAVSLDAEAQALAFAECMRDEGVDLPDPAPGQDGLNEAFQHEDVQDTDQETIDEARTTCEEFLPQYEHGSDPVHEQERQDSALEIAECMREQGFDVSDDLNELQAHGAVEDDELRTAMEECRDEDEQDGDHEQDDDQ